MTEFEGQAKKLRENVLEEVDLHQVGNSTNRVTGKIALDKAKILCLTIPYSNGWTALVDGKPAKIYQANSMFMGLSYAVRRPLTRKLPKTSSKEPCCMC